MPNHRASTPVRQGTPRYEHLKRNVHRSSIEVHRETYLALGLLSVMAAFVPAGFMLLSARSHGLPISPSEAVAGLLPFVAAVGYGGSSFMRATRLVHRTWHERWNFALSAIGSSEARLWLVNIMLRASVVLLALAYVGLVLTFAYQVLSLPNAQSALFFDRAIDATNGVSPLPPLVIGAAGFAGWCVWHLKRIRMLSQTTAFEEAAGRSSAGAQSLSETAKGLFEASQAAPTIRERLFHVVPGLDFAVLLGVLTIAGLLVDRSFANSYESLVLPTTGVFQRRTVFDVLLQFSTLASVGATIWSLYRFGRTWSSLRGCLASVGRTPLLWAFERLPKVVGELNRISLFQTRDRGILEPIIQSRWALLKYLRDKSPDGSELRTLPEITKIMGEKDAPRSSAPYGSFSDLGDRFIALRDAIGAMWEQRPELVEATRVEAEATPTGSQTASAIALASAQFRTTKTGDEQKVIAFEPHWLRTAEELAAIYVVDYMHWAFEHLRYLAIFLLLSLVGTTLLLGAYPFVPQHLIEVLFLWVLASTVAYIVFVLAQINRDQVLSRISDTVPGSITWDSSFITNLAVFGAVPILTLLSTWLPSTQNFLFQWATPLLRAIRGQ